MKKLNILSIALFVLATSAYSQDNGKLISTKTHVKFFSSTTVEDIEANNYATVSTINQKTGDIVFSVPMQGFEFEKALMQKHYNSKNFLNTLKYPKAKLKGRITNLNMVDFLKNGIYPADIEGEMTIKEVTKSIKESGTITVKGDIIEVQSKFNITLAEYGITFLKESLENFV